MHDLDLNLFIEALNKKIGTDPRFPTWEAAYKYYFVFDADEADRNASACYNSTHRQSIQPINDRLYRVNYERQFKEAFELIFIPATSAYSPQETKGLCFQFPDELPPNFRKEKALLLAIINYEYDKYKTSGIVTIADISLMRDEDFWRQALTVNPKVIEIFGNFRRWLKRRHADRLVTGALDIILADEVLMFSVINLHEDSVDIICSMVEMGPLLKYPTSHVAKAAETKCPGTFQHLIDCGRFTPDEQEVCLRHELSKYIDLRTKNQDDYFYGAAISTFFGGYKRQDKIDAAQALMDYLTPKDGQVPTSIDPKHFPMLKQGRLGAIVTDWGRYFDNKLAFIQDKPAVANNRQHA